MKDEKNLKKIVVKFGGSNLKNTEDLARIYQAITLYLHLGQPIVVVISALYGVTDILAEALKKVQTNEQAIADLKQRLMDIHESVIRLYIKDEEYRQSVSDRLRERIEELGKYLKGIHCLGEVPDFVEDRVLSFGERFSSLVLTSVLKAMGIPCRECLPENLGLYTNGEYRNASVDFTLSEKEVKECLVGDQVDVVPGFYGISPDSRVTLLGRGGSDYTAAAIARCIDAASVDLWKDVPGFMSADPKIVENPTVIQHLTYNEAAELSYFGARILHPRTFEPIMDKQIPVRLFNIYDFTNRLQPVTMIRARPTDEKARPTDGSYSHPSVFGGKKPMQDFLPKAKEVPHDARLARIAMKILGGPIRTPKDGTKCLLRSPLPGGAPRGIIKSVTYSDDFGMLNLHGAGVGIKAGIMAQVTTQLSNHRINIKSIITSQTCINILLSGKDLEKGLKIVEAIGLAAVDRVTGVDDISVIAVVGEGLLEAPGIAAKVFGAVSRHGINIRTISAGASEVAIYFIIDKKEKVTAVRSIHDEIFSNVS